MAAAWLIRVADDGSSASTTPTYPQLHIPQLTVAIDMSNTLRSRERSSMFQGGLQREQLG
jgi:hypothetical protein